MAQISSTGKKILVISFQSLIKDSAAGMGRVGFEVSKILHQHGLLQYFVVSSKGQYTTSFPSKPVSFFSRYYLFLLNRSEEHTSELQSRENLVCRLLLEKKKKD